MHACRMGIHVFTHFENSMHQVWDIHKIQRTYAIIAFLESFDKTVRQ